MRYFSLVLCLSACSLALSQNPATRVSYLSRAARTEVILKELGSLAKVDLQCAPSQANQVLVVSVKDSPLSDLMERIAKVTSGEWKHEGSTYRLVASRAAQREEERREADLRIENIRRAIAERVKAAQPKADAKGNPGPNITTPEEAIVTTLLQSIDPGSLANLDSGQRLVFSTEPTRTQHPFSTNVLTAINAFIEKHNAGLANRQEDLDKAFGNMTAEQRNALKGFTKGQTTRIGQIRKALLVATNYGLFVFSMTQLELRLYDANGAVNYSTQSILTLPGDDLQALVASVTGKKQEPSTGKSTPIEYGEDSKALMTAMKAMAGGTTKMNLSPALKAKIYAPNRFDPLSFTTTDEVLCFAKSKGKPVVANIPDGASGGLISFMGATSVTVESFEKDLSKGKSMVQVSDPNWVLLRPAFPSMARNSRLDRDALTRLMHDAEAKEIPSLDDVAQFALHAPDPMQGGIEQMYISLFVPGAVQQGLDGQTSWSMMQLYGSLSPDARSALASGGRIPLASLNPLQRECVNTMVYGANSSLSVEDPQHKVDDQPYWMKMISGTSGSDYRQEPTEIVPNGLPDDGFVELKIRLEPFASPVVGEGETQAGSMKILGADELAIFKMFKEDKNFAQISAMLPTFGKMRIGTRKVLSFNFQLTGQVSVKQSLKDHQLPKSGAVVSPENLPEELQKQIAERLTAFKKSPLGALGALMGQGRPRPHP